MSKFKSRVKGFVDWTPEDRRRLAAVVQALGISFEEFVHDATMQAVDEVEGPDGPFGIAARMRAAEVRNCDQDHELVIKFQKHIGITDVIQCPRCREVLEVAQ